MSEDMAGALLSVLRSHGCDGTVHDGEVWGESYWSTRGEVTKFGLRHPSVHMVRGDIAFGSEWQRIGTSGAEVRDWLGY